MYALRDQGVFGVRRSADVRARIARERVTTAHHSGSRPFSWQAGSSARDALLRDPALHASAAFSFPPCESARRLCKLIADLPAFERLERALETPPVRPRGN